MRIALLIFLTLLAGCNSDDDSNLATQQQVTQAINAIPSEATQVAALRAQISSLQASLNKLQLIGNVHGVATNDISPESFRTMGEFVQQSISNFGPCTDMGVLLGRAQSSFSSDPLTATAEAFQTCTGYEYSVAITTNTIAVAPRIFWDGPNCTGNMIEWSAAGGGYNNQTLTGGVVFISPIDGTTLLMVKAGQIPQPIMIQSVWVTSNPSCQADTEIQTMYQVSTNDVSITGVSGAIPASFQLTAP